ncbi:Ppx/GppA family phosphatase [Jatrophihabitans cynanchi]|jgi:exopolyphosphatase/guanosine-5'-triphosphate,3'-diphosphate pyrophosphatase|uniref:Ppx/GppA family phosphatase n=1 Tax=Jatrophihabitans cynanchi TaxID=2944128 RepID=A0ABY7JYF5_9ACTN|nr:Ppx/GppA phosphatase family protein [Jatrophihabitans sp. SB3-54]WAX55926.1 Ppx/GppA family phosphatase [Jatrophihabitans sp. SB3-54]
MTRVAGIDCGTNSIRLLIADADDGRLLDIVREMRIVRLGQGVDRTGRLAPDALERTRVALADYAASIAEHGAERVRMTATSATRDAANRADFVAMVRAELGVDPEVISGAEEAELSFRGAVAGLPGVTPPLLVADIGGGSTELVLGGAGEPLRSHSMDVGCVRMTERHLHDDPPTAEQIAATVRDLNAAIDRAAQHVPLTSGATFVGLAGTVTTIAALALGLDHYDPEAIHASVISTDDVRTVTARLLAMTHAERAALPVMHPGRVDVIGGGALVLRTLLERTGADAVVTSEHDILDGIALSLLP